MKFSENRPVAWAVLFVSVFVSIVLFGGLGLQEDRKAVEAIFYSGAGDAYFSLNGYIDRRAAAAQKLAAMGIAILGDGDADAMELSAAVARVQSADSPDDKLAADAQMTVAADALYARISASDANERDQRDARMLYADMTDAAGKMEGDEYFARADAFNRQLGNFPAMLLRRLFGIEPLEVNP